MFGSRFTLIDILIAAAMGILLVGAVWSGISGYSKASRATTTREGQYYTLETTRQGHTVYTVLRRQSQFVVVGVTNLDCPAGCESDGL